MRYASVLGRILSTLPAIATAHLGMLTGQYIFSQYLSEKPLRKVLYMVLAAIALIIIGRIWNIFFPINKYLWSSSFVCFVGGLSLLLFSLLSTTCLTILIQSNNVCRVIEGNISGYFIYLVLIFHNKLSRSISLVLYFTIKSPFLLYSTTNGKCTIL